MPYFIVYVSSATALMSTPQLHELLDQSRVKNRRLGISGAMLYQDGNIIQVLEGEADVVEDLFGTIDRDPRHGGVIRIFDGWSETKQFGDWAMAFGDLSADDKACGVGVGDVLRTADEADGSTARLLLSSFRSTLNPRRTGV